MRSLLVRSRNVWKKSRVLGEAQVGEERRMWTRR